tara:strand:- start:136 stop:1017 length:882 start_codon:yes stop_codon:yes gene_type:complete
MTDLIDILKKKRPHLSEGSLKTYKSILTSVYRKCYPDDDSIDLDKYDDTIKIMEHLKDIPFNKRKTTLSALVVLTDKPEYSKLMVDDIKEYNETKQSQKADGKFADMLKITDVETIFKKLEADAKHLYKTPTKSMADLQKIQNYVLLALTSGLFQAPRRSLDWIIKHKNYDKVVDNYVDMKNKIFVFNMFKTKDSKGAQTIEISKPLYAILKKWISILPESQDYLLFDNKSTHLSPSQITHRLNDVFGKPISTSMLRHIYLTSKFSNIDLKELVNTAEAMGNSPMQALEYVKR